MTKLSAKSPRKMDPEVSPNNPDFEAIKNFAKDAENDFTLTDQGTLLKPWERQVIKKQKVYKNFLLRLPEEYYLKLVFIANNKECSMQKICQKNIMDLIDKEISDIILI